MHRTRHTQFTAYLSAASLIAFHAALTAAILFASLAVSCSDGGRLRSTSSSAADSGSGLATDAGSDAGIVQPQPIQPLGPRPAHLGSDPVKAVPNQQAITKALWAPGIDLGYVPQGLTFADGQVLVSGYRSTSPVVFMGACRVFRVDPETGESTGYFDLPPGCGHAGGLAYIGNGVIIVSDTSTLYRIDLAQALADKDTRKALTGTLKLGGNLRGSFAASVPAPARSAGQTQAVPAEPADQPTEPADQPAGQPGTMAGNRTPAGLSVFIGAWSALEAQAKGHFLPLALFDSHDGTTITEKDAARTISIGPNAQGASFAPDGTLWLSHSSKDFGRVEQVDPASGKVLARYSLVSGTEDLGFDDQGGLWAVSEAGSLRWRSWPTSFPVAFRLDTSLLE